MSYVRTGGKAKLEFSVHNPFIFPFSYPLLRCFFYPRQLSSGIDGSLYGGGVTYLVRAERGLFVELRVIPDHDHFRCLVYH